MQTCTDFLFVSRRWRFLGLHLGPRERRYRLYDSSARCSYRHDLFCASPSISCVSFPNGIYHVQTDPCGLQLFHLLSHTDGRGGETLLVDGFYVASILQELHPEAYHTLTSVRVPTHAAGEPGEFYRPNPPVGYPILNLDPQSGKLYQVRYNNDDRSAMRGVNSEQLERW